MTTFTDDFNRTDRALNGDNGWRQLGNFTGLSIIGQQAGSTVASPVCASGRRLLDTTSISGVMTYTLLDAGSYGGLVIRAGDATGVDVDRTQLLVTSTGMKLARRHNGLYSEVHTFSTTPPASGALIRLDDSGSVITAWVDGAQVGAGYSTTQVPPGETVGPMVHGTNVRWDNLKVNYSDPLPDLLLPTVPDLWAGLLTQNPRTVQDPLTIELISRIYSRPEARIGGVWQDLLFPGIPQGSTVAALGLFDAPVNGNMRFVYVYDTPYVFSKGGYLQIPAANLAISI